MKINIDIPFKKGDKVWIGYVFSKKKDFEVNRYIIDYITITYINEKEYHIRYQLLNKPNKVMNIFSTRFVYKTKKEAIKGLKQRKLELEIKNKLG